MNREGRRHRRPQSMKLFGKKNAKNKPRSAVVGEWGEDVAAGFLKENKYRIIGRNVRPERRGEIDIIARHNETLVFVEVKTRGDEDFGPPASAVDDNKRHALNRAAAAYLRKARYPDLYYRFDLIEVIGQPGDKQPEIRHIENAFPFEKRFRFPV
jgi:putative endonuclease